MTQWNDPQGQQPPYGQPEYGQPQYGQPPYGQPRHSNTPANPFGTEGDQAFGIAGTVLGLLGGVILVVAFTAIDWFSGPGDSTLTDINDRLGSNATGFAQAYFGWLAWLFLIVTVVCAILTSFPSPVLRAFRIVGAAVGFAAAGLTFLAIKFFDITDYTEQLKHARVGFYLTVVGFVLAGIGAAIGPRRV